MSRVVRTLCAVLVLLVVLSCMPGLVPVSTELPAPAFDPNAINTVIALTANSAATQTALMLPPTFTPTITPKPTNTLTETPSPTFIFILFTPVPSSTPLVESSELDYACRIDAQSPENNSTMTSGTNFDMRWQVTNIGQNEWNSDDADYRYSSGDKLHTAGIYDLNNTVGPGGSAELGAAMKSPTGSGTFSTTWKIKIGKTEFCPMKLTIIVN